jgi:hypothetical protein
MDEAGRRAAGAEKDDSRIDSGRLHMSARKTAELPRPRSSTSAPLARRLVDMSGAIASLIVREHGPGELLQRLSDPFWFQAFGCVLGVPWQSHNMTTAVCSALKEAARKHGRDLGVVVCGGKGATCRKTPDEIRRACDRTGDQAEPLIYASRLTSRVDSMCVQDGFDLYHHTFLFVPGSGAWAVVQQGMNSGRRVARRYHWNSLRLRNFVSDPHAAIACDRQGSVLNLVAGECEKHRQAVTALTREHPDRVMREVQSFLQRSAMLNGNGRSKKTAAANGAAQQRLRLRDLNSVALRKVLLKTHQGQACDFEELLSEPGLTADSLRTLSLLAEAIYQAPASRRDPALHRLIDGGKAGQPYETHRLLYDRSLDRLRSFVENARLADNDKAKALKALTDFTTRLSR